MTQYQLSSDLFAKVRALRAIHGISTQRLAERMTEQGFPVKRSVIANAETGRVRTMSVDFADHAARAFDLSLTHFLAEPAHCPACKGEPPVGFTCNTCGGAK